MTGPIFTIGYGGRKIEAFIELLMRFDIRTLVDIRSNPYSRFQPAYRKQAFSEYLTQAGIHYIFMGEALGGRPKDPACYTDGKVDYKKLQQQPGYQTGITRLLHMAEESARLCLLCAEARPQECHRTRLVGVTLAASGIEVIHIDENGLAKPHASVIPPVQAGLDSK